VSGAHQVTPRGWFVRRSVIIRSDTVEEKPWSAYRSAQRLPTLKIQIHRRDPSDARVEDPVPLSEEELRLLEQMERALVEEDPKFASTLRGTTLRQAARRRALLAGFVFAVGIAVLMGGAISGLWQIGIVGFVIMLGSATLGLSALRGQNLGGQQRPGSDPTPSAHPSGFGVIEGGRTRSRRTVRPKSSGSFMERVEERWRRRRNRGF
jgi:hypothetical protein